MAFRFRAVHLALSLPESELREDLLNLDSGIRVHNKLFRKFPSLTQVIVLQHCRWLEFSGIRFIDLRLPADVTIACIEIKISDCFFF